MKLYVATTACIKIQAKFRRMRKQREERKKLRSTHRGTPEQQEEQDAKEMNKETSLVKDLKEMMDKPVSEERFLLDLIERQNPTGVAVMGLFDAVLLLNVLNT